MFHPWFTTTPFPQMIPGFFPGPMQVMAKLNPLAISSAGPMSGPFGMMPTAEQREEFSLALLADQKQQIAQTRQYFQDYLKSLQEHLKSLDSSLEAIDKEIATVNEARTHRQGSSKAKP